MNTSQGERDILLEPSSSSSLSLSNTQTYSDFSSNSCWRKVKIVGRGGSSIVYEVVIIDTGQVLAAKEIQIDGLTKDQLLAIESEVETMKTLRHENIVNYIGTQRLQNNFYIFLEYADRGSLRHFYQHHGKLTEQQASYCTKQILKGLQYLHSNGIAHRDIKGANVLLTKKGEMKLADFGASKRLDTTSIVSGLKGLQLP
jgi:serine/threonine protein kinase